MPQKSPIRIVLIATALACSLCAASAAVKVGVSVLPQVEIVKSIGGDRVEVRAILDQGDSCGVFDARPSQLAWLANADLFFRIGLAWEENILPRIAEAVPSLAIIDLREGLELHRIHYQHGDHVHIHWDPHTWLSPVHVDNMARRILVELAKLDPDGKEYFEHRHAEFSRKIVRLDQELETRMRPFENQVFFVYHPAFGYFAERYGLQQVAIQDQGKEPTPRQMRQLLQYARENRVSTIFVQPQESRQHAEIIARSIGAKIVDLDPMAAEWFDNMQGMGEKIQSAFSYVHP
jgi:zinc transport system substrate-binding protein